MAVLALLATACATRPPVEPESAGRPAAAASVDRESATTYRVDADASLLTLRTYRAGPLARLGHNHVLATRDLEGMIWYRDRAGRSAFRIGFAAESLSVDEPALRREAGPGFEGEIPAEDIEGTRRNMLGSGVLDAANHPRITAELVESAGRPPSLTLTVAVTVRDRTSLIEFPATVEARAERLIARGSTRVSHARLGLEPFSVMGGALSVADEIEVVYHIEAERLRP
ncbi:MAG: YceI family protein [Gammaproteobacteria bacterium]